MRKIANTRRPDADARCGCGCGVGQISTATSTERRRVESSRLVGTAHFAPHPHLYCSLQIKKYEKLEADEERIGKAREIYDFYIMRDLLSHSHVRRSRSPPPPFMNPTRVLSFSCDPTLVRARAPARPLPCCTVARSAFCALRVLGALSSCVDSCQRAFTLLMCTSVDVNMYMCARQTYSNEAVDHVQELLLQAQKTKRLPSDLFKARPRAFLTFHTCLQLLFGSLLGHLFGWPSRVEKQRGERRARANGNPISYIHRCAVRACSRTCAR